jgi:hypothetical protein
MVAFIRYPKEATTCLSRSLWSLACAGSRAFGIVAFCRKIGKFSDLLRSLVFGYRFYCVRYVL